MSALYTPCSGEIGDSAGDAQHAVIAARSQPHRIRRFCEKFRAGCVGRCNSVERLAFHFSVGANILTVITFTLHIACAAYPRGYVITALGGRRQSEIGGRDTRDLDMQIDAIEQWTRNTRLVVQRAFRRASAGLRRLA